MNNSKEYVCSKCYRPFSRKFNLDRHALKCNGIKIISLPIQEIEENKQDEIDDSLLEELTDPNMILISKQLRELKNMVKCNSSNQVNKLECEKLKKQVDELKHQLEQEVDNYECEKQELEEKYDALEKEYIHSEMFKRKMEEECHDKFDRLNEKYNKLNEKYEQSEEKYKQLETRYAKLEERNRELEENCVRMRIQKDRKINLVKVNN